MKLVATLLFLFAALPVGATDLDDQIEAGCFTEISFFCAKTKPSAKAWMQCLQSHEGVTAKCTDAIAAAKEAMAPKPAVSVDSVHSVPPVAKDGSPNDKQTGEISTAPRMLRLSGSVYVHPAGQPADDFVEASNNMPLETGDIVRTGADGTAEIAIDGGSVIALEKGTDMEVVKFTPLASEWKLILGSLVAKIASLAQNQQMDFVTTNAVAAIRGTELVVSQEDPGQPTRVGVLDEGKVFVSGVSGGQAILLTPGQETAVAKGKSPIPAKPLTSLVFAQKRIASVRSDLAEIKKTWKPQSSRDHIQDRRLMLMKKAFQGPSLKNLTEGQKRAAYGSRPKTSPTRQGGQSIPRKAIPAPSPNPSAVGNHQGQGGSPRGGRIQAKKNITSANSKAMVPKSPPQGAGQQAAGAPANPPQTNGGSSGGGSQNPVVPANSPNVPLPAPSPAPLPPPPGGGTALPPPPAPAGTPPPSGSGAASGPIPSPIQYEDPGLTHPSNPANSTSGASASGNISAPVQHPGRPGRR